MRVTFNKLGDWVNWGRMGNQMWQVAHVVGHSKKHEIPFSWSIPKWKYSKYFVGPFNEVDNIPEGYVDYNENGFHYNDVPAIHDVNLIGYWQSKRYWQHCEPLIKEIFMFKPEIVREVLTFINQHAHGKIPVALQVRRTDYITTMSHYYHNLSMEWYKEAMNKFDPETHHFFVTSDDIGWCKTNFHHRGNITFSTFDEVRDLCLGSLCKNNVIANSSFGWWQQELNRNPDKRVIAPSKDKWFTPVAGHNLDDLYDERWELL